MTQITVEVTSTWALAKAGAADVNMQNTGGATILYRVATSTPSQSTPGAVLGARDIHPVVAGTGENIYVRLAEASGGTPNSSAELIDA